MVLNGGGRPAALPTTHWTCLNCRYVMMAEEFRWRRQLAADAAAADPDKPKARLIPVRR